MSEERAPSAVVCGGSHSRARRFRSQRVHRVLEKAVRDTRRAGFRITHYSVQSDHVHIIVEAEDPTTPTNGMRSFAVRIARRVNKEIRAVSAGACGATAITVVI